MAGHFSRKLDFETNTINGFEGYEAFLAKFDAAGNLIWARKSGGTLYDEAEDIEVDDAGNIYVCGYFNDTAYFGNTTLVSHGLEDIFLAKYNSNGTQVWVRSAGSVLGDNAFSLSVNLAGEVYITGKVIGDQLLIENDTIAANGGNDADVFVAKYDAAGNYLWAVTGGGSEEDMTFAIDNTSDGGAVVSGFFYGTSTFGIHSISSNGPDEHDAFVARIDNDGNWLWATSVGGTLGDASYGIVVGKSDICYVTGYFAGFANFGNLTVDARGYNDIFLARFSPQGSCDMVVRAGGSELDIGLDIDLDEDGNPHITGFYDAASGNVEFQETPVSGDGKEVFVAKYNGAGNLYWVKTAGGGHGDFGNALAVGSTGSIFLTGWYYYTSWFDQHSLGVSLNPDCFITKLNPPTNGFENFEASSVQISPNPGQGQFLFKCANDMPDFTSFEIIGLDGIISNSIESKCNEQFHLNLHPGIYFVKFETSGKQIGVKKLIIL